MVGEDFGAMQSGSVKRLRDEWMQDIIAGSGVFDLGSGDFSFAKELAKLHRVVRCVDIDLEIAVPGEVDFCTADLTRQTELERIFYGSEQSHFFIRNLLQFLDRACVANLIESIRKYAPVNSSIYIETFFGDPDPPFEAEYLSYWNSQELLNLVGSGTKEIRSAQEVVLGQSLDGEYRLFRVSAVAGTFT